MAERQTRTAGRSCDTVASFLIKTYEILEVRVNQFSAYLILTYDKLGKRWYRLCC